MNIKDTKDTTFEKIQKVNETAPHVRRYLFKTFSYEMRNTDSCERNLLRGHDQSAKEDFA